MEPTTTIPRLLTVKVVAQHLGLRTGRVYELIRYGSLPSVRIGERQLRVSEAALRKFIESGGTQQTATAAGEVS